MANKAAPNDIRKFIMIAFLAFAVVFVFAMLMMLWHGNVKVYDGQRHYQTQVNEP